MPKRLGILLLATLLALPGCLLGRGPKNLRELSANFSRVWGRIVAPPSTQGERLFLYVQTSSDQEGKEGPIIVCVAENKDKDEILKRLADSVVESDKPLYLFGQKIKGQWKEYMEGVDFEVYAVGYYNPKAQKYQTVITAYGTGLVEMLKNVGWGDFLKTVGGKVVKTAIP